MVEEREEAILVGRKCPLGETRKREERRLSPDPIKRKRDPLVARPPLLRVDPRDTEPANKIQINSAVHTKLSHLPLPDRVCPSLNDLSWFPRKPSSPVSRVEIPIILTFAGDVGRSFGGWSRRCPFDVSQRLRLTCRRDEGNTLRPQARLIARDIPGLIDCS